MSDRGSEALEHYRAVRREIEAAVLPLASSVDGRRFTLQASLHDLAFQIGGYVVLEGDGETRLGQVVSLELIHQDGPDVGFADGREADANTRVGVRAARGEGLILGATTRPFHDLIARPARSDEVALALDRGGSRHADLDVGELLLAPGVPAVMHAEGFDRHTFLCGQSGSGKTYSLGVVLERLLLETRLRVVILDPNSDHVRLGETRADADAKLAQPYAAVTDGVLVRSGETLRIKFAELGAGTIAAILRLDPILDREEYAELALLLRDETTTIGALEDLGEHGGLEARALLSRAQNLGVDRWQLWARESGYSVIRDLERDDWRCLVVDIGSLPTADEQALVADAVLSTLWRLRHRREPVLIVVDEAHNICPSAPVGELVGEATDHAVRIAGEGRKFGLYLLVATQRPEKVHENVVSQCDNLLLMRMNSDADVAHLERIFSFVAPSLLRRATGFKQGEALFAGKVAPHATFVRFGRRITEEGGSDVPATWAARRDR